MHTVKRNYIFFAENPDEHKNRKCFPLEKIGDMKYRSEVTVSYGETLNNVVDIDADLDKKHQRDDLTVSDRRCHPIDNKSFTLNFEVQGVVPPVIRVVIEVICQDVTDCIKHLPRPFTIDSSTDPSLVAWHMIRSQPMPMSVGASPCC